MALVGKLQYTIRKLSLSIRYGQGVPEDLDRAHEHCIRHQEEIEASRNCGCFYCLAIFPPESITEWVPDEGTALCPECGIDAVIGSGSGFPITRGFLAQMYMRWF